jgi:hypothetical protein
MDGLEVGAENPQKCSAQAVSQAPGPRTIAEVSPRLLPDGRGPRTNAFSGAGPGGVRRLGQGRRVFFSASLPDLAVNRLSARATAPDAPVDKFRDWQEKHTLHHLGSGSLRQPMAVWFLPR